MKIDLNRRDLNSAALKWNTLTNRRNKRKNYRIYQGHEENELPGLFLARFAIGSEEWFLLENSKKIFNELVFLIHNQSELKNLVSTSTIYRILKKELESEISARELDSKIKKEFIDVLPSLENSLNHNVDHYDLFFRIEGLVVKDFQKIDFGKATIFTFDQEHFKDIINSCDEDTNQHSASSLRGAKKFIKTNFLGHSCIQFKSCGDLEIVSRQGYRQAREIINYFRYIVCLFSYERISEQMTKINLLPESYGFGERTLLRASKDDKLALIYGRGRKSLQSFSIDKVLSERLLHNYFLNDFVSIINASSQTQLEGCILTAIHWIGEAQNEADPDVSFWKYWTALECMFTPRKKKDDPKELNREEIPAPSENSITQSLVKGISTLGTLSSQDLKIDDFNKIQQTAKKLYAKRSDIVHSGMNYLSSQIIDENDISFVCKHTAWSIFNLFNLRSTGYTTMEEVRAYVDKLFSSFCENCFD